jgi:hypothetical protein
MTNPDDRGAHALVLPNRCHSQHGGPHPRWGFLLFLPWIGWTHSLCGDAGGRAAGQSLAAVARLAGRLTRPAGA